MRWFSRIPTVLAILAALALAALGVWLSGEGRQPSPAQGEAHLVPGHTPLPGATPYPPPAETETPPPPPTLPPDYLTVVAPVLTEQASWTETPTYTPAPPTPTPTLLPVLEPGTEVVIYTTAETGGVQLVRAETDAEGRVTGPQYPIGPLWGGRYQVSGLYPSADGSQVAVGWAYGNGPGIALVRMSDGQFTMHAGPPLSHFLAWSPDGTRFLAHLDDSEPYPLWLADTATGEYWEVEIPHSYEGQRGLVSAATFTPDGQAVLVAHSQSYGQPTELWRVALDDPSDPTLLYTADKQWISHVSCSPDGAHIAFVQWDPWTRSTLLTDGGLWIMDANGENRRMLAHTVAAPYDAQPLAPAWLPDGRSLLIVQPEEGGLGQQWQELRTNVYRVHLDSGELVPLTALEDTTVLAPRAAPFRDSASFLTRPRLGEGGFLPYAANLQTRDVVPLNGAIVDNGTSSYGPLVAWLRVGH